MEEITLFVKLLQSTISPIVLISGVGLILLSLTNRLARTIDRSRTMVHELENENSIDKEKKQFQLQILFKRSKILRNSIVAISFSILTSSFIILLLLIMNLFKIDLEWLGLIFFFLSIIGIIFSAIFLFIDVSLTLKALESEVEGHI